MLRRLMVAVLGGVALAATLLSAQAQTPLNLSGNETVTVTTPSGTGVPVPLNYLRNTMSYTLVPTGGTVASAGSIATNNLIATGAITTWNVTLPNPAVDGQMFSISNSTASAFTTNTTVTVVAGQQTQTLAVAYSGQTLAANGGRASWQYAFTSPTAGTWYRVE